MKTEDDSEFESWYSAEHPRILSTLALMTGDLYLAQEAVDEAFVRAYDRWSKVRSLDSPAGWTYRVALNLVRRYSRRANRVFGPSNCQTEESVFPSTFHEIWQMVNGLSKRQREVVVLRYIGDLTEGQVAAVLGVSRGTVSQTLRAAHERLGGMMDDSDASQEDRCDVRAR